MKVIETALEVWNAGERDLYYFVIDRESAAFTLWVALSEEQNKIQANTSKAIAFEHISGFEKWKPFLFCYWSGEKSEPEKIRNILVETE